MAELQMNITQWEGSEAKGNEYEVPEEGPAYCLITNATYDKSTFEYRLYMHNLNTDKDMMSFRYTMKKAGQDGTIEPNHYSEGTLISLGKAVFGQKVGVPFPTDIIGAVVIANIKHREYNGKTYASIYTFDAVPAEIVRSYGQIVQFSVDEGVVAPAQPEVVE